MRAVTRPDEEAAVVQRADEVDARALGDQVQEVGAHFAGPCVLRQGLVCGGHVVRVVCGVQGIRSVMIFSAISLVIGIGRLPVCAASAALDEMNIERPDNRSTGNAG
jgi:hypothetical protein